MNKVYLYMLLGDHKLTVHKFGRAKLYDEARKDHFKCILERRHPDLLNEKSYTLTAYYSYCLVDSYTVIFFQT